MKVLFVDDAPDEFRRFLELPFAKERNAEIEHLQSPVGLTKIVAENPDLRLVVLDILWDGLELGFDAAREVLQANPEIPVIIYSIMDDEERLRIIIPELMRMGAYDWVSKEESKMVRSFRFERAFNEGRDRLKLPANRAILAKDQPSRHDIPVAVMFLDMSGFTALTHQIGGDQTVQVLHEFYRRTGEIILANGGYIDKYIGDAIMAVFGASEITSANVHYGQNCVNAALSIQTLAPAFKRNTVDPVLKKYLLQLTPQQLAQVGKIRIGIESGVVEIARFERGNESEVTFIGTPVNIASRILGHAKPGEVWAGRNIQANSIKGDEIEGSEEVEYKNLPGKFEAYRLRVQ